MASLSWAFGCGEDAPSGRPDGGGDAAADEDAAQDDAAIPRKRFEATPAMDCPARFESDSPSPGSNAGFEAGGQTRSFFLVEPSGAPQQPVPMFVAFAGTGELGEDIVRRADLQDFADRGFLVVAPDPVGNGTVWPWWDAMRRDGDHDRPNADLAFFDALVPCIAAHYAVDRNRIYVGGHSAGGIMTNYVLQRRSELLAGGIVASGVFDLTSPPDPDPMDSTLALVTWGGPDDTYSGTVGDAMVPEFNFAEQASLASQFYDSENAVGQANCHADVGHAWLDELNDWMVDLLLAYPKGSAPGTGVTPPPVPEGSGAECTTDPFEFEPELIVECSEVDTDGCQASCQLLGDCVVENGTVRPVLAEQLDMIGFDGSECAGCTAQCESWASDPADAEVLSCFETAQQNATCGPGISGASPAVDAINNCCEGRTDSNYCRELCAVLRTNSTAASFFPTCQEL